MKTPEKLWQHSKTQTTTHSWDSVWVKLAWAVGNKTRFLSELQLASVAAVCKIYNFWSQTQE